MSVTSFLFVFASLILVAFSESDEVVRQKPTTSVVRTLGQSLTVRPKDWYKPGGFIECEVCINFMNQAVSLLVQIISQGGIGGGCAAVCGQLPESWMAQICFVLCEYEGIELFNELLNDADPDPIWLCMELDACPSASNSTGVVKRINVSPGSGRQGATFTITFTYQITSTTGAGQTLVAVIPPPGPEAEPFGWEGLIVSQEPGVYTLQASFESEPTQENPYTPGVYQVICEVCEGSCGDTHKNTYVILNGMSTFNITQ